MKYVRFKSIQFILTVTITIITTVAMLSVGLSFFKKFSRSTEINASMSTQQIIQQVNMNLEYYLGSMIEISNILGNGIHNNSALPNDDLQKQMNIILHSRKDIVSLAVFTAKGEYVIGEDSEKLKGDLEISEQDWFKKAVTYPYVSHFSSPHVQNLFEGKHNWVVSLSKGISFEINGEKVMGVLLVDMNFKSIDELCKNVSLGKRGYIYIVSNKGTIIYHPQQQLINMGLKSEDTEDVLIYSNGSLIQRVDGENRSIIINTVNYTGWKIVGVSYMDEISAAIKDIGSFVSWSFAFGIMFFLIISTLVSAKISKPIIQLEQSMKLVEEGNFDINIDVQGEAEVVQLSKTFNMMVAKIRYLMNQILLEQEAKRKSELDALQSQINPHFLYNTLDSIVWMAENEKSEDVITMVTALARLFRISISKGKNIIGVQQEIEHARNYLIIQKTRYKNKFEFNINMDPKVAHYRTLKLILQPIIENAIYHGIEYMVDEGVISISVEVEEEKLLFKITDNGLGMTKEVVNNLLSKELKSSKGSGVGVKNVHERIQLCFGKEYGLEIESEIEMGTTVKLWLPLIEDIN
ncbi:cache domain-containing sensor histidine kinase [Desnuesiella massiliensis]|uniref:cache domain-containing sensor histidine kinase n=1 Tax=Desnuesiella massiliensis TaxID=1650662 RepID=UPI000B088E02|nr:histidine kinase [Desnuesiella massiliensis]